MMSCQLTCVLCLCMSGIWIVAGKPSSLAIGVPSRGNPVNIPGPISDGDSSDVVKEESRLPASALTSDFIYLSTPVQSEIRQQDPSRQQPDSIRRKRTPSGFTARGFHEGIFDRDFGHFSPVKRMVKRRPEADAAGFYGDTFSNGFGEFETMKRDGSYLNDEEIRQILKRVEMGANGFHGDTFTQGFGNFNTMKRRAADSYPKATLELLKF